ncbi:LexA family protein [Streptomyces chartreusis]|uniref:LexA family protein n=1 Tax=Streptomyces chartreusis TaxID=1969 RepID=UPI00367E4F59
MVHTPLVGLITAAFRSPLTSTLRIYLPLPKQLVSSGQVFALTVSGDSMINAHITDGDAVAVRAQRDAENGEIVASSGVNRCAA